jgi:hypothetical protein
MSQYDKSIAAGGGPASGYFLKFYDTSNVAISIASASDGSGLLAKAQLDSSGYPINGSADRFIPFISEDYRPALYTNATDADADTIGNADWFPGTTLKMVTQSNSGLSITKATIAAAKADDDLANFVGGFVRIVEETAGKPADRLYLIVAGAGSASGIFTLVSDTAGLFHLKLVQNNAVKTWDISKTYIADLLVQASDGHLYKAVIEQSGNDPITDDETNWIPLQKVIAGVGSPNLIGGFHLNTIDSGTNVRANTISGGGFVSTIQHIDGDETRYGTIGGGYDNYLNGIASSEPLDATASTIGGGAHHEIRATHATIAGGSFGLIDVGGEYGTIGGGTQNTIGTGNHNTVCGGVSNTAVGGNATVLGGTGNTASDQGAMSWGRGAVASGRGSVCFATDTAADFGHTVSESNKFGAKFDAGFEWLGEVIQHLTASDIGGINRWVKETTVSATATTSFSFPVTIPTGTRIIGVQLRVDEALSNTWNAAYSGGSTQTIATAQSLAKNTKVVKMYDTFAASDIAASTTSVTITRNGGGSFTATGSMTALIMYEQMQLITSAP